MHGLLCLYDDGNVVLTITPDPTNRTMLLVTLTIDGLQLPSMAIPVYGVDTLLKEVIDAEKAD